MKPIPISTGKEIAEKYGYDQVVIYAREVGDPNNDWLGGGEHMTTYGVNKIHCDVAAQIGNTLKKWMGWQV